MDRSARPARSAPAAPGAARPPGPPWAVPAVLAAAVLFYCLPLLLHGPLPTGSDAYGTMHYLQEFMKAVASGILHPRWTDATNQGFGAPTFVFFPPLPWYGMAAASWIAGSVLGGIKVYVAVVSALCVAAFYRLAREWIGPGAPAAIASAVYLLLPYHVLDYYHRCAISETTSFIFFPLILLYARRCLERAGRWDFAALALSYAALIYTHVVSTFIFTLFLGPWLLWEARGRWPSLLRPAAAMACAVGLASPVLLPALIEKQHANVAFLVQMPNGDYHINFIFQDPPLPGLGYKDPVKAPVFRSAHAQILLAAVAALAALAWIPARETARRRDTWVLAAAAAASYLMQVEISAPIWAIVPQLPTVQFPWRFQTLMVLAAALLVGVALEAGARARERGTATRFAPAVGLSLIAAAAAVNVLLAWHTANLKPFAFDQRLLEEGSGERWMEPAFTPVAFEPYLNFRGMAIDMPKVSFASGKGEVRIVEWSPSRRVLDIDGAEGGAIAVRTFWFPGWTGSIDGRPLPLSAARYYGNILFEAPPGRHTVELRFEDTPLRRRAGFLGLVFVPLTAIAAWAAGRRAASASP